MSTTSSTHAESTMSGEANKENTEPDNINVGLVATITIVGALLVVAIAAALTALVRSESAEHGNEIGAFANLGGVRRLKEEQIAKLNAAPGWSDRSKGLVSIPIDRAMSAVAASFQKNPYLATPNPPGKAEDGGAALAPAPAPSASTGEPAASAAPAAPEAAPATSAAAPPASAAPAPSAAPEKH